MPYVDKLIMVKEEKDLTNAEIATLSNIPLATVTRIFSKQTLNPTFETISSIAIGMGVSLDELVGLKQPDEPPIPSNIENTLNSYSELLKEKDIRIEQLLKDKKNIRNEKYVWVGLFVGMFIALLIWFIVDISNGHFGIFRY